MDDILKIAEFTAAYIQALRNGMDKFAGMLPILTQQKITSLANEKLDTSRQDYLDAVKVDMTNYLLVVELDEDSWLANAVETGADPFDMKKGLLNSPKARLGKPDKFGMRYRYLRVPMGKQKDAKGGDTEKSQAFQKKINDVMNKPQFGMSRMRSMMDGTVVESQPVLSTDPDLQGLYRTRQFESSTQVHSGKKPAWNLVLFRTVTDNPLARGKWQHPGIKPANIFRETENWLKTSSEQMLETFMDNEIEKIKG